MTEPINFSGKLAARDALWLARLLLRSQKGTRLSTIGIGLALFFAALSVFQVIGSNARGAAEWAVVAGVVGIVSVALRTSELRRTVQTLLTTEQTGNVTEEGVQLVGRDAQTLLRWPSFVSITERPSAVALWLTNGTVVALAESMFESAERYEAARETIRSNVPAA